MWLDYTSNAAIPPRSGLVHIDEDAISGQAGNDQEPASAYLKPFWSIVMPKAGSKKPTTIATVTNAQMAMINPQMIAVPEALRRHSRVKGQCFYVLPLQLCNSFFRTIGNDRFNSADVELETELAEIAQRDKGCVWFRDGRPMQDALLKPAPFDSTVLNYLSQASATLDVKALARQLEARSRRARISQCGYLGWLYTNPQFLKEFAELLRICPEIAVSPSLPPRPIAFPFGIQAVPSVLQMEMTEDSSAIAMRQFCQRWRLQSISGPRTLQPLGVQFPVMLPPLSAAQSQQSGALLYTPDIAPLPERDELRDMMEESVRGATATAEHLNEWTLIVHAKSLRKKTIETYARWFRIQHYMRVIYSRHSDALHECNRKMEAVVSEGLRIASDTLHRDLIALRKRLGPNWFRS